MTLAGVVLLYFGYRFVQTKAQDIITQYTDTNAVTLGHVELSQEKLDDLKERITRFSMAMESQTNAQELLLSAEDINGLITADDQGQTFRDRLFVRIEDNLLQGDVSIPLQDFGPIKLEGRFLNGAATFKAQMVNGKLDIRIDEVRVNDKLLPAIILSELKNKNLADEMRNNPESAEFINKFESIEIKDGMMIIRNKVSSNPATAP
jgi:hypothetical protein